MVKRRADWNPGLLQERVLLLMAVTVLAFGIKEDKPPLCGVGDNSGDACFGDFCYKFLPDSPNWNEAKQKCSGYFADLLNLHSDNESKFISQLLCTMNAKLDVWTGAYDRSFSQDKSIAEQFTWIVRNSKCNNMDWTAPTDLMSGDLYGTQVTILLAAHSGYQNWTVTDFNQTSLHAVCKWRMDSGQAPCPMQGFIYHSAPPNCSFVTAATTSGKTISSIPESSASTVTSSVTRLFNGPLSTSSEKRPSTFTTALITTEAPTIPNQNTYVATPPTDYHYTNCTQPTTKSTAINSTYVTGFQRDTTWTTSSDMPSSSSYTSSTSTWETTETNKATTEGPFASAASTSEHVRSTDMTYTHQFFTNTSTSAGSSSYIPSSSQPSTASNTTITSSSTAAIASTSVTSTSSSIASTSSSATTTITTTQLSTSSSPPSSSSTVAPSPSECEGMDYGGCTWPDTPGGETAITNCPNGTLGQATWYCDSATLDFWTNGSPDFSDCEHDWVDELNNEIGRNSRTALELAESMWLNTTRTSTFYSKDLSTLQEVMFQLNVMYVNETVNPAYESEPTVSYTMSTYNFTMFLINTCNVLVDSNQSVAWDQLYSERATVADELTNNVESVGFIFASPLKNSSANFKTEHIEIYVERRPAEHYNEHGYQFDTKDTEMDNWNEASVTLPAGFQKEVLGNMTSVVTVLYSNMQAYLGNNFTDENRPVQVITNILGISIGPVMQRSVHFATGRVQFKIPHTTQDNDHVHICSFWNSSNYPTECWDASGCNVETQDAHITTCSCDHLTDFAVLLDINGVIEESSPLTQKILNVLTILCGCLSIISLIFCLIIFQCLRVLRSVRTSITKNLCICLLIENLIILTLMNQTANKIFCAIIAATLEYILLAAFMWMLLEGIHLYRLVIQVFDTCTGTLRWYYLTGYGIPLIIVSIAASIDPRGYGTDSYCWLDTEDNLIWSFAGPVIVVILVNFCIIILALRTANKVRARKKRNKLLQLKKYVTGVFSLTSILGLTWIFGFFYTKATSIAFAYIFTILNASQGVFIFVFQCIVNDNVRKCLREHLARCTNTIPERYKTGQRQARDPNDRSEDGKIDALPLCTISNSVTTARSYTTYGRSVDDIIRASNHIRV